ncbi:TonB family protein [Pendulispora albinea]|uniref:TonB family protein n=1 Tax=Pendulispora albinea TaxID=2741071 RepID=A0ABZ2M1S1_9BACT
MLAQPAAPTAPAAPATPGAPAAPAAQTTPPTVVTHVDAVYPASALKERKHGDVTLAVTVDVDGHVSKVDVLASDGPDLDEAATVAVRQWTFVPAMRNGKPVASRIRVPFHFAPPAPPPEVVETQKPNELPTQITTPPPAPGAAKPAQADEEAAHTDEVTVAGRARTAEHGASDYHIDVGALAVVPRKNAADLLKLAPGILLTNEGGEGHAEQVFLRGFDAREGQDLEFTVDGVPINDAGNLHGNGLADSHFIIPELVESLRVIEGPFAPQQGNFAVAGSADFTLGLARRGLTGKYTVGSYDTHRLLLTWGPSEMGSHTFGGAEYYTTDGFGQNRQAKRGSAIGQYETRVGERGLFRVTAQAYHTVYNSAGVLRQESYDSGKKGFFDTEDPNQNGNTSSRYSLALAYETKAGKTDFAQQVFLIDRGMRLRDNFTGFLLDVQLPIQQLHGQRGDLIDLSFSGLTFGARGSARFHAKELGLPQEIEIGYYARGDRTHSTQNRIQAANDAPYKVNDDIEATLGDIGVYADANIRILKWLGLRGGIRADMFSFNVLNNCAVQNTVDNPSRSNPPGDKSCLDQQANSAHREPFQRSSTGSGALMPKGTLLVGPIQNFQFTASYGKGVRSVDPAYVSQDFSTPFVSIQAYEAGVTYARSFENVSLSARSVFFRTHVDRDLIFNQTEGRNTLSNGATRTGWAGSVRVTGPFFDQAATVTAVRATFDDTHLLVPYVPDLVVRSDTALFHELPWKLGDKPIKGVLGYGLSYVGPRPLPYDVRSDAIFVSDASVALQWRDFEVSLAATNLFGSRYRLGEYNYTSNFAPINEGTQPSLVPGRHFSAGAPRQVFLSLSATFGGP